eukprot:2898379-Pleurochrysis_carterae.AAC.2
MSKRCTRSGDRYGHTRVHMRRRSPSPAPQRNVARTTEARPATAGLPSPARRLARCLGTPQSAPACVPCLSCR